MDLIKTAGKLKTFSIALPSRFCVISIIIIISLIRIWIYGDPKLSIATNDTSGYVESSHAPLFSWEMMTGRRLLGTNLLYKILEPKTGYHILVNGSIYTTHRLFQPGFDRIVLLQLIISIMGWGFLAFTISEFIRNPSLKILSTVTIILFAFTPQIADWDSILMSESLVFSLFALQLAFLVRISFLIIKGQYSKIFRYLIVWSVIFFVWAFLRDTNLFTALITMPMIGMVMPFIKQQKNKNLTNAMIGVIVFITVIFILGFLTSSRSTRSQVQMINIYHDDLLRDPARSAILEELGMPAPDSVNYQSWFKENSSKTLIKFMLLHPGYPTLKIIKDFPSAFTEIKQTYFKAPEQYQVRQILMEIGNALHPENTTPFLLDVFLIFGLIALAKRDENIASRPWAWIGLWLFLTASATLVPTILGDTWALNRHALLSTMIYRLFMWIFSIIIMDIALSQKNQTATEINSSPIT